MSRFFALVILLYCLPHAALYARLRPILPATARIPTLVLLLLLMLSFFAGYSLHRQGIPGARLVLHIAFFWMAFVFWFFCAGLLLDAWNVLVRLLPAGHRPLPLGTVQQLKILGVVSLLVFCWSAMEARLVRVKTVAVPGLSASRALRIAVISDLHLSPYGNQAAARRAFALLRDLQPDVILSAGDMMDAPEKELSRELGTLAALQPPLGKYAVLGNHESYTGIAESLASHKAAGFTMLRASAVEPAPGLILAGVDDGNDRRSGRPGFTDESAALPEAATNACVILLKHRPFVTEVAAARADLQISGHTHGGQLFPFHGLVRLMFPQLSGLRQASPRAWLYVTRGTGTWGPPLRLFAPPEITLIAIPARR